MRREFLDELRESYFPDLRGGKAYIDLPRHAAYVDKDTYRGVLMSISARPRVARADGPEF